MANKQSAGATPCYEPNWDSDHHPIVLDTAASKTMTPLLSDLIDPVPFNTAVSGIGTGKITHRGKIRWQVLATKARSKQLRTTTPTALQTLRIDCYLHTVGAKLTKNIVNPMILLTKRP